MALIQIDNCGFSTRNGGNIGVNSATIPGPARLGAYGIGFGPLRLAPFSNTVVGIPEMEFFTEVGSLTARLPFGTLGVGSVAAAGLAVSTTDDEPHEPPDRDITRREFAALFGAAGAAAAGLGGASETAVAQSGDTETRNVARFDVSDNPRGFGVYVDDVAASYLPPETKYFVSVDGGSRGSFDASDGMRTIPAGITGEVYVESTSAKSLFERILDSIKADEQLTFSVRLSQSVDQFGTDEVVPISDQPVIVDPIRDLGRGATRIAIGDRTIPHLDSKDERGGWYLRDNRELVYVVGESAPPSELVEITVGIGRFEKYFG